MASMSLQEALDRARRWLENNEIERATGLSQHILEQYPSTIEAHRILGEACLAERRLDASQAAFEHVLAIDPENIPAHVGLGIVFERRQKIERAMVEFERAFEIKPDLPELRSQLLRLYSEAWGGDQAKLRLSRAGLARMYARGHMLSQAIAEFRQVTEAHPDRYDAQVALAETLWRNDQEDDAADLCRRLLQKQPAMLKPNLLLGYIELHAGRVEGERYWRAARQADPGMQMARTLFATLPDVAEEPLTLPEWDEIAWRNRRAAQVEEPELVGSTRAMESHAVTPIAVVTVPVIAVPAVAAVSQSSSDDFLAQLLALESPPLATQPPQQPKASSDFVFDDLVDTTSISRTAAVAAPDLSPEEEASLSDLPPFSLADLGLSDREIAALNAAETEPASAPEPLRIERAVTPPVVVDESITDIGAAIESGTLAPFSFADLGLTDEEIAALSGSEPMTPALIEAVSPPPVVTPPVVIDESITDIGAAIESGTLAPFSFADLGLSDEEIAALNAATEAPATSVIETAQAAEQPAMLDSITDIGAAIEAGTLAPFSFADLGLSDEEIAALNAATDAPAARASTIDNDTEAVPFSLADLGIDEDMTVTPKQASARAAAAETISPELAPFSFESIESIDDDDPFGELPAALQPFSLDEIGADVAASNAFLPGSLGSSLVRPREDDSEALNLSWQEPGSRLGSSLVRPPIDPTPSDEPSLFDKLSARRATGELPPLPTEVAEDGLGEEEHLGLFSLDNVLLREDASDEADTTAATPDVTAPDTIRSVVMDVPQPFSLDDLGLNAEEMAALGLATLPVVSAAQPVAAETEMFSLADLGIADDQPAVAAEREITSIEAAIESGELAPFSFADLGLSDAEVAALGLTSEPPTAPATPAAADDDEFADFAASLTPFSFSDLGLDDDSTTVAPGDSDDALNVTPFSLNDLGLEEDTDSEIDLGSRLGLTEEELEGLESGGDVNWAAGVTPTPASSASPETTPPDHYEGSGDAALDRLIMLGQVQGQVDISDIIAAVEHPEENAERIEYIGAQLHISGIAIFDGEELIDMDAEAVDEPEPAASTPYLPEPVFETPASDMVLEPFSLGDLGLLDDLDTLPAAAPQPVAAPSATEEIAALEPFSLAELGLTDDEIAMLSGGAPMSTPAAASSSPIESVSLDALGLDTTPAPVTPAPLAAPPRVAAPVAVPAAVLPPPRIISGVSTTFAGFVAQVEQDPENIILRLSVARAGMQLGEGEIGLRLYRDLIRRGAMLEDLTIDVGELVEEIDDIAIVRRLYRILGDAYTRQGRIDEAMQAFAASRA